METAKFILYLKRIGVSVSLSDGQLRLRADQDVPEHVLAEVRERKPALIALLSEKLDQAGRADIIIPAPEQESYPLSHAQQRFWILSQSEAGSRAYNIPGVLLFEGELDIAVFSRALDFVIGRHESLRTVFRQNESGDIRQYILPGGAFPLPLQTFDLSDETNHEAALAAMFDEEQETVFDLESGPLLRTRIVRLGVARHAFFYTMHHIISDGWSLAVLTREIIQAYNCYKQGHGPVLPSLPLQYKDYAQWQHSEQQQSYFLQQEQYWLQQFSGPLPVLELPFAKRRPAVRTFRGASLVRPLSTPMLSQLKDLCVKEECTLFMGLLAGLNALFFKYTGQEDIILGTPVAGREHPGLEDQIGLYINSLALRTRFEASDSFLSLLRKEKTVLINAYRHQAYPYDKLVARLTPPKDTGRQPLFDILVGMQNQASANIYDRKAIFDGLQVSVPEGMRTAGSHFDVSFTFVEAAGGLELVVIYNTDIFNGRDISDLFDRYEELMLHAVGDPGQRLSSLSWIGAAAQQQLEAFSGIHQLPSLPAAVMAPDLFEAQARATPEAVALVHGSRKVSYRELNEAANRIAHYLREKQQVKPGQLVGLMAERSPELVSGLLGIWKAGAGYVPLDAGYPEERIVHMLTDAGIRLVLTGKDIQLPGATGAVAVPLQAAQTEAGDVTDPVRTTRLPDIAYMIYTSGSTGAPKGVQVTHGNAAHFFAAVQQFGSGPGTVFPFVASPSFDISLFQLLTPLLSGGASLIADRQVIDDLPAFTALLQQATMIDTVPGVYNLVADHILDNGLTGTFDHVEKIFIGGDTIPDTLLQKLSSIFRKAEIVVTYGPTEGTIFCTAVSYNIGAGVLPAGGACIGRPLPGSTIYILDKDHQLLPAGVMGEICIGGAGVSACYFGQPELTSEKFLPDPLISGGRIYCSGDLGRWNESGEVVFMGRRDTQVKIRGFRIETGEIERALLSHEDIREAVVMAREDGTGSRYLAAYLVTDKPCPPSAVRSYLSGLLPDYMLPGYYISLPQLPLTGNGKIDRQALPEPGEQDAGRSTAYAAASNDMEALMVQVWEAVLGRTGVSVNDNFFEIGGDSIKSIQIVSRLRKYGYALSVTDVLQYPTPAEQALQAAELLYDGTTQQLSGNVPLSPAQRAFLENEKLVKGHFNQSVLLFSRETISEDAIRAVFHFICRHHDALRLRFEQQDGIWTQTYSDTEEAFSITVYDWKNREVANAVTLMEAAADSLQAGMLLHEGPLVRLGLFRLADGDRLLIVIHHLVTDGVSLQILLEDIAALYRQYLQGEVLELPAKTDSFKHWMEQLNSYALSPVLLQEQAYWEKAAAVITDPLPLDYPAGQNLVKDTQTLVCRLTKELSQQLLTEVNRLLHSEMDDVLLTALGLALRDVFGMRKVLVSMEGHGRQPVAGQADISRTVGWFTSIYPVVLDIAWPDDPGQQLRGVKETLRAIPDKGIGYGILKYLGEQESTPDYFNRIPEIRFNYLGQFNDTVLAEKEHAYFSFSAEPKGNEVSETSEREVVLELTGIVFNGVLSLDLAYSTGQFDSPTMEKLLNALEERLVSLIRYGTSVTEVQITPQDLGDAELSMEAFNNLFK
ncbi:amino acid adenylation domain-containing protein [Chitinophaga oryzae]|uniref:Amino acid adenylation domain-containing protein n=1 Tax=Chitinophaga oryzae TaxID=2725414 RepID=A0AAE6ZEQ6_9BACT|nr:non-ribosomal peptide synthetase [Chitinophaga oryzae]QJB31610.1 amino acid adenylation domain-containing protein [Chitinophaga oryzae]